MVRRFANMSPTRRGIMHRPAHRYGHRVVSADWSSATERWTLACEVGDGTRVFTCSFLLGCAGYYDYESGHQPQWHGAETFGGRLVHSAILAERLGRCRKARRRHRQRRDRSDTVPALAETAATVTMLQRSPSYVASLPSSDAIAMKLRSSLPRGIADALVRWKKHRLQRVHVSPGAKGSPKRFRKLLRGGVLQAFGPEYDQTLHDVDVHFNPAYERGINGFVSFPTVIFFARYGGNMRRSQRDISLPSRTTGSASRTAASYPRTSSSARPV